jgi:beta-glucosidase
VNAGIDLIMVPEHWKEFIANTVAQVRAGDIPPSRIDDAVTRILRVKLRAGLFEKGRPSTRPLANHPELLGSPEHRAIARQAVRESLVLLKNEGGVLPLRRKTRVLVAGDGADSIGKQTGGWTLTWQGTENTNADFPGATSVFAGIKAAVSAAGGTATLSTDGSFGSKPDVAIVVFGENPYAEWHGDIKSLEFRGADGNPPPDLSRPWPETPMPGQWAPPVSANVPAAPAGDDPNLQLIQRLRHSRIPVVAVFLGGRGRVITPELQASNAFVVAWLPGTEGGGIADVLFRNTKGAVSYDFTGRLSYAWPSGGGQYSASSASDATAPLFPYGYGLSYCNRHCDAPLSQQPWQTQQSLTSRNTPASP